MSLPTAPIAMVPTPAIGSARGRSVGLLLAVASALTFSSSGPFIKPLLEAGWSLSSVLTVRMGVAGVLLAPALILAMKRQRRFIPRHARTIVLFGLTAVAGCQIFFFSAMQRMPVAVALLIQTWLLCCWYCWPGHGLGRHRLVRWRWDRWWPS